MADDTDTAAVRPGPLDVGDVDVSSMGTQTTVAPDASLFMRGGAAGGQAPVIRPFPSPALPPWIPTAQQAAAAKAQEDQDWQMRQLQQQIQGLPIDQAQRATVAALKFQGQRGYQNDLAAGKPAHEALAKWAPMMFYDRPQIFSGAVRQSFTTPKPSPRWVPADPNTGAPGHFESSAGTIHVPKVPVTPGPTPEPTVRRFGNQDFLETTHPVTGVKSYHAMRAPEKEGTLNQVERDDLRFAEREADRLQKQQEDDTEGRRALALKAEKQTPRQAAAAEAYQARQRRLTGFNKKIDTYHARATATGPTVTAPGAAAPAAAEPPAQVLPYPKSKGELKTGSVYNTRHGPARWNGQQFVRVAGG